jgi:murein tripeptide amidase MpaA
MRMRIKIVCFFLSIMLLSGQEYYGYIDNADARHLPDLNKFCSIDHGTHDKVRVYANEIQRELLRSNGFHFIELPHPGKATQVTMYDYSPKENYNWDAYPTYDSYIAIMNEFAELYPEICRLESIGLSENGRELLCLKITDNPDQDEVEPGFFYTGTMHGDEVAGFVLLLRLADYLLSNYGIDERVQNIINNTELWINPLANPDGTYASGNHTVFGATRYNANWVDLNRNFPDPEDGDHPDGNVYQAETLAMMDFAENHRLVMSANFHGGAEVVNYPWDTWSYLHADNEWFEHVSRVYADAAQENAPDGYMDDFNNGITNGYAWYTTNGNRQDYMNYFFGCKEVTIELSHAKIVPESQLNAHWNYNKEALLAFLEQVFNGIYGQVLMLNSAPGEAKIKILSHDHTNSEVYTDASVGDYHRLLLPGTYRVLATETNGSYYRILDDITVGETGGTWQNIYLYPDGNYPPEIVYTDPDEQISIDVGDEVSFSAFAFDPEGQSLQYELQHDANIVTSSDASFVFNSEGNTIVTLRVFDGQNYSTYEWQVAVGTITSIDGDAVNEDFRLLNNYPNPFNATTTITFILEKPQQVQLVVFNAAGQQIIKLTDNNFSSGMHRLKWNGKDNYGNEVASGIYYYRLSTTDYSKINKMVLLK